MTSFSDSKLDLLRGDIIIAFHALAIQAGIADGYIALGSDEDLAKVITDAAGRARQLIRLRNALLQAKDDAAVEAEVATDYRAQRGAA